MLSPLAVEVRDVQCGSSDTVLCLSFAFVKALHDRRPPGYEHGLVRKPLRKICVILLHNVEDRFPGEPAMVLGEQPVHGRKLFIGHGAKP